MDDNKTSLTFFDKVQLAFMRLGIRILRLLGFGGIRTFGRGMGWAAWRVLGKRRRYTIKSVQNHLQVSQEEATAIAKASFGHTFCSFMEAALAPEFSLVGNSHLRPHDKYFEAMRTEKRPVIAVSAHIGGWELLAGILPYVKPGTPQAVVGRIQKNRAANELIFKMRGAAGGEVVGHRNAAPVVTRILRQNGITAFLVDHNTSRKEANFIKFLGEEASVNIGPAMLALRSKAIVYPLFLIRHPQCVYELVTRAPLDTAVLEGSITDKVRQITEFYTKTVEDIVREYPEQWLWMHERWKTRPR